MRYEVDADGAPRTAIGPYDMTARPARTRSTGSRSTRTATSTSAAPAASGSSRPRASTSARCVLPEAPHNLAWGDADGRTPLRHGAHERLPHAPASRHPPDMTRRHHEQGLDPGDDAARLRAARRERRPAPAVGAPGRRLRWCCMLGRGEHCPRERQHQREMLKFHEWCSVAFTQLVTVLPNDLHDVFKLKISTGAHWTFLADTDLEVQTALRHPRVHRPAPRPRPCRTRCSSRRAW